MWGLEVFKNWRVNKNIAAYKKLLSKLKVNVAMLDKEATLSKSKLLCEVERKKCRFCKQLLRAIFYITFRFISDINKQDQVQTSSIDTDANSKENQIDAAKHAKQVTKWDQTWWR